MASPKAASKKPASDKKSASASKLPYIILLVLIVLGAGAYFGYVWYLKQAKQEWQSKNDNAAQTLMLSLVRGVNTIITPAVTPLNAELIGPLLKAEDQEGLEAVADEIAAAGEHVIDVRIVEAGREDADYSSSPALSYSVLALLMESEASGEAPPPELHFKGKENEYIAVVRRVEDAEGTLLGHVVYYLSPGLLDTVMARAKLDTGYAELQQTVAGSRPLILGRVGNSAYRNPGSSKVMPVKGTGWRLVYWSDPPPEPVNPLAGLPLMQVGGAAAALLLGVVAISVMRRRRASADDESDTVERAAVNPEAVASGAETPPPAPIQIRSEGRAAPEPGIIVEEGPGEEPPAGASPAAKTPPESAPAPTLDVASHRAPEAAAESPLDAPLEMPATAAEADAPAETAQPAPGAGPQDIPASIFRAYDIRGVVGKTLNAGLVRTIGRAIGTEAERLGQRTIAVGRDGRTSSAELSAALIEGIRSTGRDVVDIGEVPTPLVYFATHYLETGSGVMVTGSHNPPEYNGLKIMLDGETLFGDRITAIRERALSGEFASGDGGLLTTEVVSEYIRRISEDVPVALGNSFKVVIDCGNGVAGAVAPQLIRALGHDVVELYCDVDGKFPNHHPDPSVPANLKDLIAAVKENSADIGFAFDGDGDRLGVVDGNGTIIFPDRQLMLFARDVLSRNPGAEIIFDVKCTSRLPAVIQKLGGKPVMWKTGHSFIKGKLKETGAPLGGEMSGHIFFKERWYGFDDALYAAARMLEILMGFKQAPAEIFKKLPRGVATPELRVDLPEEKSEGFMEKFIASANFGDAKLTTIDGLRADFSDGWGLVRPSNTTPCLVLRFEGDNKEALNRIGGLFKKALLSVEPDLKLPF